MRRIAVSAALSLVALGGCVERAAAPPAAVPTPVPVTPPPPEPTPAQDWRDWPVTPGTWVYARDSRGTRAMFGAAGADAAVVLRCDRAERRLYLSRAGAIATPLTVRTASVARAVAVQPTGGAKPYVAASLAANDPLLDAMAFSRGRVALEQQGVPALVVPAWAEIGRVIEDCRG